jgi:hypothetical protein
VQTARNGICGRTDRRQIVRFQECDAFFLRQPFSGDGFVKQ